MSPGGFVFGSSSGRSEKISSCLLSLAAAEMIDISTSLPSPPKNQKSNRHPISMSHQAQGGRGDCSLELVDLLAMAAEYDVVGTEGERSQIEIEEIQMSRIKKKLSQLTRHCWWRF